MFEGLVRQLILGYLGRFLKDIQKDQLKITLWNEEVLLENVELILDAFDYLRLPFSFKQGRVGKLSIKIPWKKLGWDPIIINLEDLYVCISKRDDKEWSTDAVEGREYASKKAKLAAAELAKLSKRVSDYQTGKSFISYITAKILDGIQVSIQNFHVLFHDTLYDKEEFVFGLKFSSLTVMRQTSVGSSSLPKIRGGQVNKSIKIQGLELYSSTLARTENSCVSSGMNSGEIARDPKTEYYSPILMPLDVYAMVSVDRTGRLLNDAPQYTINAEIPCLVTTIDEVQLLHIFSICDYLSVCGLREKYGCYRPWWSPLEKKLNGWQKAWWHYAQKSVLSDVRKRLKKTSWKYFGQRLSSRRKYVNLYKDKLKCLRYDEAIEDYLQQQLEDLEKHTDIEEILYFRSIAERELEDLMHNQSLRHVTDENKNKTTVEDDRATGKLRGWLNWLSNGVLGAGGTDEVSQFSGVISDDVINDIYEATKFHPAHDGIGDSVVNEVYLTSIKLNIFEVRTVFRRNDLGLAISEINFEGVLIESKGWEKTAIFTASVNMSRIINPLNGQVVFILKKVFAISNVEEELQPSLSIKVDVSPPTLGSNTSIKITVCSPEIFCDLEMLKNILDFVHVLWHVNFQQQRILLSLNAINSDSSRLLSKIEYFLSIHEKIMWGIDIFNLVINIPTGMTDGGAASVKVEVRAIMVKANFEVDSSSPYLRKGSHILTRCADSESSGIANVLSGFELQDLYEPVEIQINDAQMMLMRSSATIHLVHKFSCAVNLLSCILLGEPSLKGMEIYLQAPSLVIHFSASIYREIFGLISWFNDLIPPSGSSASLDISSNELTTSLHPWISFSIRFNEIKLLVNIEDSAADECMVSLEVKELGVWCDTRDVMDCWASVQACQMVADAIPGCQENHSLIAGTPASESMQKVCIFIDHQNRYFVDETLIVNGCIVFHFEGASNAHHFSQKCSLSVKELDVHCYPYVIGKLICFVGKVLNYGVSDKSHPGYQISAGSGLEVGKKIQSNHNDSTLSASIQLDCTPSKKIANPCILNDVENVLKDMGIQFSEMLPQGQKFSKKVMVSERSENDTAAVLHPIYPRDATENYDKGNCFLAKLDLVNVTVHFHDASCIMWSLGLPSAELVATISGDAWDVFCSTQGLVLSTSWWCQIVNEFLWGPMSPNHSQVLNIQIRRSKIDTQKSLLILTFDIQHVLCMLPPGFLALLIDYFSLPDWCPLEPNQPADCISPSSEDSIIIKYCIEIAACDLIVPSNTVFSEFLKANIDHLSVFISLNDGVSGTQDIPFDCCIDAREFTDKALCIDFLGCEVSICLLISEKEMVDPSSGCQNFVLIPYLCLDSWLRIPFSAEDNVASTSAVCLMANVKECCIDIEVVSAISGLKALLYIIEQFSLVDKESQTLLSETSDVLDLKEYTGSHETSNITRTEMKFCVQSVFLRFLRMNSTSHCCQLLNEAEIQFVLTVSLMDDKLHSLKISVFSLAIFSFLNSVALAHFASPGLGLSVLDVVLSFSDSDGTKIVLSCSSANIWLHLSDWDEVICLLSSFPKQISKLNAGVPTESSCNNPVANNIGPPSDADSVPAASSFSLILEDISLNIHFPALEKADCSNSLGLPKQPSGHRCFISFNLRCRNSGLIADGKMLKFTIISENLSGILKLFGTNSLQTWPLFQLSKIYINAEILNDEIQKMSTNLLVRCDGLHFSLSNHMKYLFQFRWFHKTEETPSKLRFEAINIKLHLQKVSILLSDRQWTSNGPLIEFLVRSMILHANASEDIIEGSASSDLQVNYYSIDKVSWEPFLEPCKIQLTMKTKQFESSLLGGGLVDIHLESKDYLNLNINESIIEVVIRTIEMAKDVWISVETRDSDCLNNSKTGSSDTRYAPYMLQNLTTLPLFFSVCQQQPDTVDLGVSPPTGVLDAGSSALIYINESPEEILFRYRPIRSCDKLNDMQFLETAHRYVTFQLEGASLRSPPISMDLSGRRYFEVEFSKSSQISEAKSGGVHDKKIRKVEGDVGLDGNGGFFVPVVIDVSVQRFTKLIRLYSTVVILNATPVLFEVRLDIPFGLSSKVLGPIYPGQEFPLPIHLAKVGSIRWRPVGDSYLWSEASNISSIISRDVKIGFFRSFVCYPSQPSNEAFRCCISVNDQCLPPLGRVRGPYSPSDIDADRQAQVSHGLSTSLYQVVLTSPLVLKNYLMRSMSITFEAAGFVHTAYLSEVETSFHQVDSSSDLLMTFKLHGFKPSTVKYPRAESFSEKAKFSGTSFSISEIVKFDPESSDGALYVTVDKVMDAVSGAREILISVPFLLYNCTGFSLLLSNTGNELKGHSCAMPSCYDLDEEKAAFEEKNGLASICSDKSSYKMGLVIEENMKERNLLPGYQKSVRGCLFSPDPSSYSGEVIARLSRNIQSIVGNSSKHSWSIPFSLVPPTGSISIFLPQPTTASGYVLTVTSAAAPFSGRTKVITFQPRYIITNASTRTLCYKQKGTKFPFTLGAGCHSHIHWMDMNRELLLSIRFNEPGWEWSGSFLPEQLGDTQVKVRNYMNSVVLMMRVEVRSADVANGGKNIVEGTSGNSGIRLIILSVDNTGFMPYRINNHSMEALRIYQLKCESFETLVHPYTCSQYAWDEPCYPHRLIVEVPGERILGSYAIDDNLADSLVHLPETSEKPERHLVVTIHSEGAIKVISVTDASRHDVSVRSLPSPQLKYREKQASGWESSTWNERISLDIAFLGVSLMNAHPEELLYVSAKNAKVNFVQGLEQQLLSLQITSFQIDNQIHTTSYPVILSFNPGNKGNNAIQTKVKESSAKLFGNTDLGFTSSSEAVFSLAVSKWRNTDASLVSIESVNLRMADVFLEIEQEIVLKLFEFGKKVSSRLESKSHQHMHSSDSTGRMLEKCPSDCNILHGEDFNTGCSLPNVIPIGAPWQQIHIDQTTHKKVYVEQFDVGPIKLTLSFSSTPWILRNGTLTSGESLIHRGLMALADVEGAKIHFRQFTLSHKIASFESIQEILAVHYSRQFLQEMYKVLGSAGVIGNPVGFARSLGLGISDFFSLPSWRDFQSPTGLITGMAYGTTSLLSNTIYAISDATSQFTKAAHKGIVAFTLDEQVDSMKESQQKGAPSRSRGVINEFLEGLTGVLQSPIQGAEKHGLPGVLSGVAVGVAGLLAKPAASILEVTGKTAQSIKNRSRIHQMGGFRCFRIRLPRPLSTESSLKPYSWEEAIGTYVLHESDPTLRNEVLVMCKALKQNGDYALITGGLVLVVSCSSLVDLGTPDFSGVPVNPDTVILTRNEIDSIILAKDGDGGEAVHIVGTGTSNASSSSSENRLSSSSLPIFHTVLQFPGQEDASEFQRMLNSIIHRRKERGLGSVHILHRCKQ